MWSDRGRGAARLAVLALAAGACGASPIDSAIELAGRDGTLAARLAPGASSWARSPTGAVSRPARGLEAQLAASADGPLTVRAGDVSLALRLEGARPAPLALDGGRALEADVLPAVDAVHVADAARVESFYLLRDATAPTELAFTVERTALPTVSDDGHGALLFADAAGIDRLRIPRPFALDAAGTRRDAELRFADGRLTVALDARGLRYPILLDPAVETPIWTQVSSTGPSPRDPYSIAYDSVRKRVFLFGGATSKNNYNDTWEWDGATWNQLMPATSPSARCCFQLAFDSARGRVVLFGGSQVGGAAATYNDTWEWDGTTWAQIMAATSPSARWDYGMTYDVARGVTMIFGGVLGNNSYVNETWTWDGANWTQKTPATLPVGRVSPNLTYDSTRNLALLFGGASQTAYLNDTWTWDGTNWAQLAPSSPPPLREASGFAFDSRRGKAVLFGGYDGRNYLGDTWEWDGAGWTQLMLASSPAGRLRSGMAFDAGRGRVVLFGGRTTNTTFVQDTWEMHTHGEACGGGATCDTGFCVDGLCCETSGCPACQDCNTATSPGVCAAVTNQQDPDSCFGLSSCNGAGMCVQAYGQPCSGSCAVGTCVNGYCCNSPCSGSCVACNGADRGWPGATNGLCADAPAATNCGSSCASSTLISRTCDGAGTCVSATQSCGAYACAGATACKTSCATVADCASGASCTAPTCNVQYPLGHACALAGDCASGHCSKAADGSSLSYCTTAACVGCTGGNTSGACVNASAGTNPNGLCAAGASAGCQPGSCNGAGACTLASAGTPCGTNCAGSTLTDSSCNGAGACVGTTISCCPYACGAGGCKTGCASDADCCAPASRCVYGACTGGGAPAITSTPSSTANAFEPYHYAPPGDRVTATGSAPLRFLATGAGGLAIDPLSGQLYFTPLASGPVSLSVSAANPWGVDTQTFTITVGEPQPPMIAHDANGSATVGVPYVLDGAGAFTVSGAQPLAFVKVMGPPELSLGPSTGRIDWTPLSAGSVTVAVQAKNAYGADSYQFTVAVGGGATMARPTAVATAVPSTGTAPLAVQLDSSGSTAAPGSVLVARSWTFGDGTPPSTAIAPQHLYAHGAYVARLVVQDNFGGADSATAGVQATLNGAVPPLVRIQAQPSTGPAPLTVSFTCDCAQAPGASLRWTFGDGDESSSAAPTHVYTGAGGYQVTLQALDENSGELGVDSIYVTVTGGTKRPPTVRAFADPVAGDAPLSVKFASQLGDPDGKVVSFAWSLGEGDSSTDASPVKTFTQPGLYHVELRAADDAGLQSSASVDIQVTRGGVLPPSLLSKPTLTATVGVPYRYGDDGRPHVRGGRPLTFGLGKMLNGQLGDAPRGMTVDPASGAIAWTPTADQGGAQPVTLTVENAAGADFQDFVVQVDGAPRGSGCGCQLGARSDGNRGLALSLLLLALSVLRLRAGRYRRATNLHSLA